MQAADDPHSRLPAVRRELGGCRIVTVPPFAAGVRLDGFLQRHGGEPECSRSEWQRLIGLEAVRLNGQPSKPGQRVAAGDRVAIEVVSRQIELPPAEDVAFTVV